MGILQSSFRAFMNGLSWISGLLIGLLVIGGLLMSLSSPFNKGGGAVYSIKGNAQFSRAPLPITTPVILSIEIDGVIGLDHLKAKDIKRQLLASREGILSGDRVKAILLTISSPGGAADDSYAIYSLLQEYKAQFKVPIYTYVEGLCASGGMMIASASEKIYSQPTGLIGSVGVRLGPVLNFTDIMRTYGIGALTLTEGKFKDMLNSTKPFDEKKYACLVKSMASEYQLFVDVVTKARPNLDKTALVEEYGAQVYSPFDAQKLGYIDVANATQGEALTDLAKAAQIEGPYQVVSVKKQFSLLEDYFENDTSLLKGKIVHSIQGYDPTLAGRILFMYE
ncbi:MAG: S49 family peptidase [Simkaniaceae bacterium]|nr:S49 family peptidase [Simkaniaceae bacterium]